MARGFKFVTPKNWLEPDRVSSLLVKLDHRSGMVTSVDGRDWISFVNDLKLNDTVPVKVRDAYEFTIGAIGYAYFYYPLFTIVTEQVLRVADFAVAHLFALRSDLPKRKTFQARIEALRALNYLDEASYTRWDAIRNLRNRSTHPEWQQTWGPSSLDTIRVCVELVSNLPWSYDANTSSADDVTVT